uniref:Uncharacterized protein n=1 Tax=Odontella aurita TaxID=265563 RepID=A0A6U6DBM6_9STRA|mmetsp:Transcript_19830/g.57524  ORF Transcript_19830/g.57524 Transcript_19830/m.57524 type:complete len:107 (+) Transcript_19830:575-895(+)
MGYLTHWGHAISIVYFGCSLKCCLDSGAVEQPDDPSSGPKKWVKLTWAMYSTIAPLEIGITLLYWSAISSEPPSYIAVMEHGGIMAMILLDGLFVGMVPVRAKHIV